MSIEFSFLDFLQIIHTPLLDKIMILFTHLGDQGFIWVCLTLVLLLIRKTRKIGVILLISLILDTLVCNVLLKNIFMRPRPCTINPDVSLLIPRPQDYSFPSGHTAASFAIVSVLCLLKQKNLFIISLIVACLIAFSRMYLYVHFPSDIIGGIFVGILCGFISYLISLKIPFKNKDLFSQ